MFELKIGKKELKIKFAYEPTLKARIISRMVKLENTKANSTEEVLAGVEDMLLLLPEIILVGLQKFHKKEYSYDYDTEDGKQAQLKKIFALMDEYFDEEDADVQRLYQELEEEMLKESFLSGIYKKEQEKQEAAEKSAKRADQTEMAAKAIEN